MAIALYARKSTESEDRQVQSLEDQRRELLHLAERENLGPVSVYEESRSAKTPGTRPEFERLLADIERGHITGVLSWSFSRLSRNPVDGSRIAYLLQTKRLAFIRTADRIYRPEDNALLLSIENGMATAYLQDLSRNVQRGMRGKAERGWHVSKAPLGYRNDAETREITIDPERFRLVRQGWELMLSGTHSVGDVHRKLVALGLTVSSRRRTCGPVSRARLHTLFRDPFYKGTVTVRGGRFAGRHQAMVTEEEFDHVQAILRRRGAPLSAQRPSFSLSGALRCAACGCLIVGERRIKHYPRTGRTAVYTYYHCAGSRGCSKRAIREDDLLELLEDALIPCGVKPSLGTWLKEALTRTVERELCRVGEDTATLQRRQDQAEGRLRQLSLMRLDGEISVEEYRSLRGELEADAESCRYEAEQNRTRAARMLRFLFGRIDAAVAAGELSDAGTDGRALGHVLRIASDTFLNLSRFELRLDSCLQKIAAFEPLRNSSESPKSGDLVPLNSVWWSLVEELRTTATDQIEREDFLDAQRTPMQRREERKRRPYWPDPGGGFSSDNRWRTS